MKVLDPKKLSDEFLEHEILMAERWVAKASADLRSSSARTSEDGMIVLTQEDHSAKAYLSKLIDERSKRQIGGTYNPKRTGTLKETVIKKNAPNSEKSSPAHKSIPKTANPSVDPEEEQVPIIVFDENGFPRAWRKGDPIY